MHRISNLAYNAGCTLQRFVWNKMYTDILANQNRFVDLSFYVAVLLFLKIQWTRLDQMGSTRCQPKTQIFRPIDNALLNDSILDVCPAEHHTIQKPGCRGAGSSLQRQIAMFQPASKSDHSRACCCRRTPRSMAKSVDINRYAHSHTKSGKDLFGSWLM